MRSRAGQEGGGGSGAGAAIQDLPEANKGLVIHASHISKSETAGLQMQAASFSHFLASGAAHAVHQQQVVASVPCHDAPAVHCHLWMHQNV